MLKELLAKKTIQYCDDENIDWKDAINIASNPLINDGSISPRYVDSMIKITMKEGPYFNIGPEVVLQSYGLF